MKLTDNLIVDQGWEAYITSIQVEFKRVIGIEVDLKTYQSDAISFQGQFTMFSIAKQEYAKNNARGRKQIVETRWTDFLWNMNDEINNRIDFIQQFDPDYNPREHRG